MASLNDQQAGRDFESFDDDRKEGRYEVAPVRVAKADRPMLSPEKLEALRAAEAVIERAFGRGARERYLANQTRKAA